MAATSQLRKKVRVRFREQGGKCYWCKKPCAPIGMTTAVAAKTFGIKVGSPGWRKTARDRFATAEHLVPKSQGGTDAWPNIVMACKGCNGARGDDTGWRPAMAAE